MVEIERALVVLVMSGSLVREAAGNPVVRVHLVMKHLVLLLNLILCFLLVQQERVLI